MVTTTELVEQTGLNVKTLTRWSAKGILPAPRIGTHPSGRGKVGFWPDWIVDFCMRVQELRGEGVGLEDAAAKAMHERYMRVDAEFSQQVYEDMYGRRAIRTPDGREYDLTAMLRGLIAREVRSAPITAKAQRGILAHIEDAEFLSGAIHQIQTGYHVFLTFDGDKVHTAPDFLLHAASGNAMKSPKAFFAMPLTPLYHEILRSIGLGNLVTAPTAAPANSIWMEEKDKVVEYKYFPGGTFGFRLLASQPMVIGEIREDGQKYFLEAPGPADERSAPTRSPKKKRRRPQK
jgi:hypothetical protein